MLGFRTFLQRFTLILLLLAGLIAFAHPLSAAVISGTVTQTAVGPMQNSIVNVYTGDNCNPTLITENRTNEVGVYSVTVPDNNQYYLRPASSQQNIIDEYWAGIGVPVVAECRNAIPLDELTEGLYSIDFKLEEGGTITGTVSGLNGPIDPGDKEILLKLRIGDPCGSNYDWDKTEIRSDDTFTITGIPRTGYQYPLHATTYSLPYFTEWYAGNSTSGLYCLDANIIEFVEGETLMKGGEATLQ